MSTTFVVGGVYALGVFIPRGEAQDPNDVLVRAGGNATLPIPADLRRGTKVGNPLHPVTGTAIIFDLNPATTMGFWQAFTEWLTVLTDPPLALGVDLYAGHRPPDAQTKCTTVLFGMLDTEHTNSKERFGQVQLLTRGETYGEAESEANRVYESVIGRINFQLSGGWVVHSVLGSVPRWQGFDTNGHYQFIADLTVRARRSQ